MKIKWLVFFCFFFTADCLAQETSIWGNTYRVINAKPFAGKNFTVQIAAKVIALKKNAGAGMWVSVTKENKKSGFYKNMSNNPIVANEWKVYSLSGKIDKTAESLTIGFGYSNPGIFYFDDFKLLVENAAGTMEEIPLANAGFEEDSIQAKYSWMYKMGKSQYKISLEKTDVFSGKQSCKVDGSALISLQPYGENDSAGRYATVNGIKIYYEEYGTGEPLLLLHGNSMAINSFRLQIPELSKYFHVYAIDTRGHGKSGDDGKTYTYDLFADDMNALLEHLHLDSVNVLGWSDGGNTGLIMAMKYPKKVKKLITMGAVIFIDNTVVDKALFKSLHKERKELESDSSSDAPGRIRRIDLLLTEPKHTFEQLQAISCPVLVIAGEKDVVKEAHTRGIAAHIPNAILMIVPKATHQLPWEDAPLFNKAVVAFLKK
ncbi:alpha/beta fold hydrolase [Ferruginibacter sp. SUN106]|uniref:alpha/beta fold hydrolase n=1 Tax=Ferruginibacter sp. SUN106 TaxID=2978348 RepID=UPI003D3621B6